MGPVGDHVIQNWEEENKKWIFVQCDYIVDKTINSVHDWILDQIN